MIAFTHRRILKPWRLQPLRAAAAAPPPTGLLVNDTFTDTDTKLLSNHVPDLKPASSAWVGNSFAKIYTNHVAALSGNYANGSIDATAYDVQIIFSCTNTAALTGMVYDSGILARIQGGNSYRITINVAAKVLRIVEYDGSTYISRASISIPTLASGTAYTISAVLQGASISAQLDGANDISYSLATTNLKSTIHGLYLFKSTVDWGDNFSIEGL